MSVLTIRVIRSFEYRNVKLMILKNVDLENTTTQQLMDMVNHEIQTNSAYLPHRNRKYDTLKLYHKAHSFKVSTSFFFVVILMSFTHTNEKQ